MILHVNMKTKNVSVFKCSDVITELDSIIYAWDFPFVSNLVLSVAVFQWNFFKLRQSISTGDSICMFPVFKWKQRRISLDFVDIFYLPHTWWNPTRNHLTSINEMNHNKQWLPLRVTSEWRNSLGDFRYVLARNLHRNKIWLHSEKTERAFHC